MPPINMTRKSFLALSAGAVSVAALPAVAKTPHPNPMPPALRDVLERDPKVPVLGNPNGNVTLTEFMDYNCDFCRRDLENMHRLILEDKNLRVVMRDWTVFGEGSMFAAKAAIAAREQGKYWQLHAGMLNAGTRMQEATVIRTAAKVGLDTNRLRQDMEKREVLDLIYQTMDLADTMQLTGTPTFVAGHEGMFGYQSLDDLRKMVATAREQLL